MLHAGLDLSRKRLDVRVLDDAGDTALETWIPPDRDGLHSLVRRVEMFREPVRGVIEAMNGARFVHDQLEQLGWEVEIADAARVKGLAPLACKTDRIDAWVLAELSRRDLVPAIWLPSPGVRAERERVRWRLHLVKRRTALKNRVHSILIAFGYPKLASDLFGAAGRAQLETLEFPDPWHSNLVAALRLIDELDTDIVSCERDLRRLGADHPYVKLLMTAPGIGWVLGYTIAAEIGDIGRFASAKKLTGYTGLCPKVDQSGESDWRGPLAKNGPRYLRWALIEAATHAAQHPCYRHHYERTKRRCGKQRGAKIARVEIARKLATAIWDMLTRGEPFAPAGPDYSRAA
jgi:transposase